MRNGAVALERARGRVVEALLHQVWEDLDEGGDAASSVLEQA